MEYSINKTPHDPVDTRTVQVNLLRWNMLQGAEQIENLAEVHSQNAEHLLTLGMYVRGVIENEVPEPADLQKLLQYLRHHYASIELARDKTRYVHPELGSLITSDLHFHLCLGMHFVAHVGKHGNALLKLLIAERQNTAPKRNLAEIRDFSVAEACRRDNFGQPVHFKVYDRYGRCIYQAGRCPKCRKIRFATGDGLRDEYGNRQAAQTQRKETCTC